MWAVLPWGTFYQFDPRSARAALVLLGDISKSQRAREVNRNAEGPFAWGAWGKGDRSVLSAILQVLRTGAR